MWKAQNREYNFWWFAGYIASFEIINRAAYFRGMAKGWKVASFFVLGMGIKNIMLGLPGVGDSYAPTIGAYLRKFLLLHRQAISLLEYCL